MQNKSEHQWSYYKLLLTYNFLLQVMTKWVMDRSYIAPMFTSCSGWRHTRTEDSWKKQLIEGVLRMFIFMIEEMLSKQPESVPVPWGRQRHPPHTLNTSYLVPEIFNFTLSSDAISVKISDAQDPLNSDCCSILDSVK